MGSGKHRSRGREPDQGHATLRRGAEQMPGLLRGRGLDVRSREPMTPFGGLTLDNEALEELVREHGARESSARLVSTP